MWPSEWLWERLRLFRRLGSFSSTIKSAWILSVRSVNAVSLATIVALQVCSALNWALLPFWTHCPIIQAAAPRSTTVILVKNLPAGVAAVELEELFSPHGSLGRVLLPPSGLTAIVEFLEPTEAKRAFKRLAYSKVRQASYQRLQ